MTHAYVATPHSVRRVRGALSILALALSAASACAAQAVAFDVATLPAASLGPAPVALAVADLDGEERAGLVTVDPAVPSLVIWRGLGGATFARQPGLARPASAAVGGVIAPGTRLCLAGYRDATPSCTSATHQACCAGKDGCIELETSVTRKKAQSHASPDSPRAS